MKYVILVLLVSLGGNYYLHQENQKLGNEKTELIQQNEKDLMTICVGMGAFSFKQGSLIASHGEVEIVPYPEELQAVCQQFIKWTKENQ